MHGRAQPTKHRPTIEDDPDRRVAAVDVPPLTPEQLRSASPALRIDPRLRSVHRCFERWAVTRGTDHQLLPLMARPTYVYRPGAGRPTPLEDAEAGIVDGVYKSAPAWARQFVKLWYRAQATVAELQEVLSIKSRQSVYQERQAVLFYFLGRLLEAGLRLDQRGHGE